MTCRSNIRIRLFHLGGIDFWPKGNAFRKSDPLAWGITQASVFQLSVLTLHLCWPLDGCAGGRSIRGQTHFRTFRSSAHPSFDRFALTSVTLCPRALSCHRPPAVLFPPDAKSRNELRLTSNGSLPTTLYRHSK